jgi:hypothetical protein
VFSIERQSIVVVVSCGTVFNFLIADLLMWVPGSKDRWRILIFLSFLPVVEDFCDQVRPSTTRLSQQWTKRSENPIAVAARLFDSFD